MLKRIQVYPATIAEYDHVKQYGQSVMFVVNGTRRDGYKMEGWYVYESARVRYKCAEVDHVIDPMHPEG